VSLNSAQRRSIWLTRVVFRVTENSFRKSRSTSLRRNPASQPGCRRIKRSVAVLSPRLRSDCGHALGRSNSRIGGRFSGTQNVFCEQRKLTDKGRIGRYRRLGHLGVQYSVRTGFKAVAFVGMVLATWNQRADVTNFLSDSYRSTVVANVKTIVGNGFAVARRADACGMGFFRAPAIDRLTLPGT